MTSVPRLGFTGDLPIGMRGEEDLKCFMNLYPFLCQVILIFVQHSGFAVVKQACLFLNFCFRKF